MRNMKKVLAGMLVIAMTTACLAGCGGKKGGDLEKAGTSPKDIEISYWNSGLGREWLDNVIEAFEKEYPDYNVFVNAKSDYNAVISTLGLEDVDTTDIYMGIRSYDKSMLEPIDALLETTCEGDTKKLSEKFSPEYLRLEKDPDGHYYGVTSGGGALGIVYNKEMFKKAGIDQLPRTTDELALVCDTFYSLDKPALAHFSTTGYWDFITEVWMAQYDGVDYYLNNLYGCTDENGVSPSKEVFTKKDGRYYTLLAYEKFITPEYVLTGSNSTDHITMQTMFLNGSAAMMVNGSWLSNEMESAGSLEKFEMMRLPVISSITDRMTTIKDEELLRSVISAVDSVLDGEKQESDYVVNGGYSIDGQIISEEDWNIAKDARTSVAINYGGGSSHIPTYSNAKEGAMKFLEFMYSDKGYTIMAQTTHIPLPMSLSEGELDISNWNEFEKSQYELLDEAKYYICEQTGQKHRIYTDGGAHPFCSMKFVNFFCSKNPADRLTADEFWEQVQKKVEDKYEHSWLANIK